MSDLHISALYQYPLKSCRGIALTSAQLTPYGMEQDRHWMVVDKKGRFLTQRRFPRMALITAEPCTDGLMLQAPGMPDITIATVEDADPLEVRIWGFESRARDGGDVAAAWLSEFLQYDCRLAAPSAEFKRPVDTFYDNQNTEVLFSDGFPFLLISQASLDHLNAQLAAPVPMDRFRPNIVVTGCAPHAEDGWRRLQIGEELIFDVVKPCERCTIPLVDQATGERGEEPIATLSRYRQNDGGDVLFGQNLIHVTKRGTLRVGDPVTVVT